MYDSGQSYIYKRCIYSVFCRGILQGIHQIYGHIWCLCTVFLAGKSPSIRSYTASMYGSGQPYNLCVHGGKPWTALAPSTRHHNNKWPECTCAPAMLYSTSCSSRKCNNMTPLRNQACISRHRQILHAGSSMS